MENVISLAEWCLKKLDAGQTKKENHNHMVAVVFYNDLLVKEGA